MRVLFLVNVPSPYRVDFFNELGKLCDLTVLFECKDAGNRNTQWFNNKNQNFNSVILNGKKLGSNLVINLGVIKYLDEKKFDIIVVGMYSTPTGMLAIHYLNYKKIPFILNIDGGFIGQRENNFIRGMKKYFISRASFWLSTGKQANKYLEYYGADPNRIFTYPFSSIKKYELHNRALSDDEKSDLRNELGIASKKVVVSVGQFIYRKGMDALIETWSNIDNHEDKELIIIGGGELEKSYNELIREKSLSNVSIIGFQNKEQILKYLRASDLMVLMTREDIWGLVVDEAMACGLPVITTDRCLAGLELIKNGENGFVVPVDNVEEAAQKLSLMINDENLLCRSSQKAIESVQDFTVENMALVHMDIFNKIKSICP